MLTWTSIQETEFNRDPNEIIWLVDFFLDSSVAYSSSAYVSVTDCAVPLTGTFAYGRPSPSILEVAEVSSSLNLRERVLTTSIGWIRLADDGIWRDLISSRADRGKSLRVRFRYGTPIMDESDFVYSHFSLVDDWTYVDGVWDIQLKEPNALWQVGSAQPNNSWRGHPLDVLEDLLGTPFLHPSDFIDTASFDPETVMPDQAHWMIAANVSQYVGANNERWVNGHLDRSVPLRDLVSDVLKLLPGLLYIDSQGRYAFQTIDPATATQVDVLTESDCEFEPLTTVDPLVNTMIIEGNEKESGGFASSVTSADATSVTLHGTHDVQFSSRFLNGHAQNGIHGQVFSPSDAVGTTVRLTYSTTNTNGSAHFIQPISGTESAHTTIPTNRTINGTRTLWLQFVSKSNPDQTGIAEFDALAIPVNTYIDIDVATQLSGIWSYDTSGTFPSRNACDVYDITIQRYMGEFWTGIQSNGNATFRINTHMGKSNLEVGDYVGISTRKYTQVSRRDGTSTGDDFLITSKSIDKYNGRVYFEVMSLSNPATTAVTTTPNQTPVGPGREPYFDTSGAIFLDASGSAYYPR